MFYTYKNSYAVESMNFDLIKEITFNFIETDSGC